MYDVGYRIRVLTPPSSFAVAANYPKWAVGYGTHMGELGMRSSLEQARKSAASNGIRIGTYEVWKFHVGNDFAKTPYFMPEKVWPEDTNI